MQKTILRGICVVSGLFLIAFSGCENHSNPGPFWTDRARSGEQVTPAFAETVKRLAAAIRKERRDLNDQDQKFKRTESEVWKLREEAAKQIRTRADRDIYWRLDAYAQKVGAIRSLTRNQPSSAYLPALRAQVDSCGDEVDHALGAQPFKKLDPLPLADEPCTAPVPP